MKYKVGDRVKLNRDIFEEGEDVPPGRIARRGEEVIVRRVNEPSGDWTYGVSHPGRTDNSFGVSQHEIGDA